MVQEPNQIWGDRWEQSKEAAESWPRGRISRPEDSGHRGGAGGDEGTGTVRSQGAADLQQQHHDARHRGRAGRDHPQGYAGVGRVGPLSKRVTNPVNPDYPWLGANEKPRADQAYAEVGKEPPPRKAGARNKPEWQKSTVIPIIMDKKVEPKPIPPPDPLTTAANVPTRRTLAGGPPRQRRAVLRDAA